MGYNRKHTVAVWVGNFSGEGVPELTGADMATPLLFDIFNSIDYNSKAEWFAPPAQLDLRLVCSQTGLPPGENCSDLVTDYFIPGISPYKKCEHVREVAVDPGEKISYCRNCCPETGYKKVLYPNLPPAVSAFYLENGISFKKVPPHNPECSTLIGGSPPRITSPVNRKEYLLEKNAGQQIQLSCNAEATVREVYWYINDRFYQKAGKDQKVFFMPEETGTVKISCSDDQGRNSDIKITISFY